MLVLVNCALLAGIFVLAVRMFMYECECKKCQYAIIFVEKSSVNISGYCSAIVHTGINYLGVSGISEICCDYLFVI